MSEVDIIAVVKANLRLESESRSEYDHDVSSGRMYRTVTTIRLMFGDQCLGEVDLP